MARRERNRRTATRMLAVAHALDGLSRAEAARLVGLERQTLRDAVVRYDAEGVEGLRDRPKPGPLSEAGQAVLVATILRGPDLEQAPAPSQPVAGGAGPGPVTPEDPAVAPGCG
jgi:transposase